jgi:hypothetical protein
MTDTKKTLQPITDAINQFLQDQKDYDKYLEDLKKDYKLPEPKDLKMGGKVYLNKPSVIDKPLYVSDSNKDQIKIAKQLLYKRRSLKDGGSPNDRIKELQKIIQIVTPAIKDSEGADIFDKAHFELKLLQDKAKEGSGE